jgi:hypothetical protein
MIKVSELNGSKHSSNLINFFENKALRKVEGGGNGEYEGLGPLDGGYYTPQRGAGSAGWRVLHAATRGWVRWIEGTTRRREGLGPVL